MAEIIIRIDRKDTKKILDRAYTLDSSSVYYTPKGHKKGTYVHGNILTATVFGDHIKITSNYYTEKRLHELFDKYKYENED